MSATATEGFFMKFHLRWGGGCGVIWGGLSHPKPKPSYVPDQDLGLDDYVTGYVRNRSAEIWLNSQTGSAGRCISHCEHTRAAVDTRRCTEPNGFAPVTAERDKQTDRRTDIQTYWWSAKAVISCHLVRCQSASNDTASASFARSVRQAVSGQRYTSVDGR